MQIMPAAATYVHPDTIRADGLTLFPHLERRYGLIVLVHGLNGHPQQTWGRFPKLLFDDPQLGARYDVALYGYATQLLKIPFNPAHQLDMEAKGRLLGDAVQRLLIEQQGYQQIALVCHSMGGLLAQWATLKVLEQQPARGLLPIQSLTFLATPRYGSPWAGGPTSLLSNDFGGLQPFGDDLTALDRAWTNAIEMVELPVLPGARRRPLPVRVVVAAKDEVVPALSAAAGIPSYMQLQVMRSHTALCKPENQDDEVFRYVRRELTLIYDAYATVAGAGTTFEAGPAPLPVMLQASVPRTLVRDAVQQRTRNRHSTIIGGIAGIATLSFLTVAGISPLLAAAAGITSLSVSQAWLAGIGGNVLAGILQSWGMEKSTQLLSWTKEHSDADLQALAQGDEQTIERLAAELELRLATDAELTGQVTELLERADILGGALQGIAAQIDVQSTQIDQVLHHLERFSEFSSELERDLARLERSNTAYYSFTLKSLRTTVLATETALTTMMQEQLVQRNAEIKMHVSDESNRVVDTLQQQLAAIEQKIERLNLDTSYNAEPHQDIAKHSLPLATSNNYQPSATPPGATSLNAAERLRLLDMMLKAFKEDELELLCLRIEARLETHSQPIPVNMELIGGNNLRQKIHNLIDYCNRRGVAAVLVDEVRCERPNLNF